ncbi:MAG: NAD(P)H-dependent oxidoreductase, partial [Firmicutes bacterium]|nr:NAD(P)H-dependent oxidoreductase [Bacillota bacterium]
MKKIIAINGSPKGDNSISAMLINQISKEINIEMKTLKAIKYWNSPMNAADISEILLADTLLIVFPLYVDALPASLIKMLKLIETELAKHKQQKKIKVFAVCNCGLYEAQQNSVALDIVQNFCVRTGLLWCYGIGIGCGGILTNKNLKWGFMRNTMRALQDIGSAIKNDTECNSGENTFINPKMPRLFYSIGGTMGWLQQAKRNGV